MFLSIYDKIMGMKGKLKKYEKDIITLYSNNISGSKLAHKYDVSESSIYRLLKRNNIRIRKMSIAKRKYSINENYFDNIDSEGKAYFLGFLYADGYNNEKKKSIYLTLHKKDINILNLLNDELGSNKPLREDRGYIRLAIENVQVSNSLVKNGCGQNKHNILKFPTFLNKNLIRHFIRGFFDGDGSITKSKTGAQMNITSNKDFIISLQEYLMEILDLNKTKIFKRYKNKEESLSHTMYYGGKKQLLKFYNYFYKDSSFYLKRKKHKFEKILEITVLDL